MLRTLHCDWTMENKDVVDVKVFSREEGDKLDVGVIKKIQVSVAQLRKAQVGDKLGGRHGNKGLFQQFCPKKICRSWKTELR